MEQRRVLVVEDDPGIADLLQRGLGLHDIETTVVTDGPEGLAAWMVGGFDVIVLDVMLPGIDGLELLAERRAAGDRTPVILLTAHDDDRLRERGAEAGAAAFLVKPFAYFELLACVDRLTAGATS
jgi:DNA-binding response OmpR family regulator